MCRKTVNEGDKVEYQPITVIEAMQLFNDNQTHIYGGNYWYPLSKSIAGFSEKGSKYNGGTSTRGATQPLCEF